MLNINSRQEISEVRKIVQENLPPILEYDFTWLQNIIDNSMDEYLIEYLTNNPPNIEQYIFNDAKEHFYEINTLLAKCNSLRDEIYRLESVALMTGVDYIQLINSIDGTEKIKRLDLKANFNLSQEVDFDYYNQIQNKLNENIKNTINIKFSLHNQKGNALNFGERVAYLREIYSDTVRILFERIIALKRALQYSYNQKTDSIPNYFQIKDNLYPITRWVRKCLRQYEANEQQEQIVYETFYLSSNINIQALKQEVEFNETVNVEEVYQQFLSTGNSDLLIDLDNKFDSKYFAVRVVGLCVNIINYSDKYLKEVLPQPNILNENGPDGYDAYDQINRSNRNSNFNNKKNLLDYQLGVETLFNSQILYNCILTVDYQPDSLSIIEELFNEDYDNEEIIKYMEEQASKGKTVFTFTPTYEGIKATYYNPINFYNIKPCFKNSIKDNLDFNTSRLVNNLKFGKWNIQINPASFFSRNYFANKVDDAAVTLKLAVRRL